MSNLCLGMFMAAFWSLQPRWHMGQVTLLAYQISASESESFQRKLCLKRRRRRRILFTSITIHKWCHPIVLFNWMPFVVTESQQICSVQTAPNRVVTEPLYLLFTDNHEPSFIYTSWPEQRVTSTQLWWSTLTPNTDWSIIGWDSYLQCLHIKRIKLLFVFKKCDISL